MAVARNPGQFGSARRQPVSVPIELHYSTGKLVKWIAISAIFVGVTGWIFMSGGIGSDYHGRDAGLMHLLGPQGTQILFGLFGLGCLALLLAYLRLLIAPDRLAISATADGLSINGVWGRKSFDWRDVSAIGLHATRARSREIYFIKIIAVGRRDLLIPIGAVSGGLPAVQGWIHDVQPLCARPSFS